MALTRREVIQLAQALEERSEALRREVRGDTARVRAESPARLAGEAPDRADLAFAEAAGEANRAELARDLTELGELDEARLRLAQGTYGRCVACGGDVGFERLRARPGAARCLACQRRLEASHST